MFQTGDCVVYGIHGVCRILGTETKRIDRKNVEYFVLESIDQAGTRFYVPRNNETAVAKLKPMLTQDELTQLLRSDDVRKDAWIADENQRKQAYRELIALGDRFALLQMAHTLHLHKKQQLEQGKRLHLCDENFLRDVMKVLGSEFAQVLDIDQNDVAAYVRNIIEK